MCHEMTCPREFELRRSLAGERPRSVSRIAASAVFVSLALAAACALPARAQEAGGVTASPSQQLLNPLANVTKLSATLSFDLNVGPDRNTQPALNFQPVIPFEASKDWHVITRSSLSVIHLPAPETTTGLGDLSTSFFLTPDRTGPWVWGVGPILQLPTATDPSLGTGKWSAGPTAALLYVDGPWVNGVLVSQLWSFAGPRDREDVSLTQVEIQLSYTFQNNWYVQTNPTFSYDWKAPPGQGRIVPIGIDIGKVMPFGARSLSVQAGAYYNMKKSDEAANWVLRAQLSWVY